MRRLMAEYKRGAERRHLEFSLKEDEFRELTSLNCHYCGSPPSLVSKIEDSIVSPYLYNGLDRVDNLLGYTRNNVVPCCKTCNGAKSDLTAEEFFGWIDRIIARRLTKGG